VSKPQIKESHLKFRKIVKYSILKFKSYKFRLFDLLVLRKLAKMNGFMVGVYRNRREFLASQFLIGNPFTPPEKNQGDEYTILTGPFAGVKYKTTLDTTYNGDITLLQKVYGSYEQEILDFILVSRFDTVIDIGAGDGYYGIGLLAKEKVNKAFFMKLMITCQAI